MVLSVFDHAVSCSVKSGNQTFKDKAFINRPSANQIKHVTATSKSRLGLRDMGIPLLVYYLLVKSGNVSWCTPNAPQPDKDPLVGFHFENISIIASHFLTLLVFRNYNLS